MSRFDKYLVSVLLFPLPPILLFLLGWWGSLPVIPDNFIFIFAFAGLGAGVLLDFAFLRRWRSRAFHAHPYFWFIIYLFYSICFFGFFMGVPVFNLLLGIPAGVLAARRVKALRFTPSQAKRHIIYASRASVFFIALACLASAVIALSDSYTASNLEGMFQLPFSVTTSMIYIIIGLGGLLLLLLQYFITKLSGEYTLSHFPSH